LCLFGTIAAVVLLISSTSTALWELFDAKMGAKLAQVYGGYVWAHLLMVLALVLLLRKHRAEDGAAGCGSAALGSWPRRELPSTPIDFTPPSPPARRAGRRAGRRIGSAAAGPPG
jgi:hypothetical protein